MNEAEPSRYICHNADIALSSVFCDFENKDAYYPVTEYVKDVSVLRPYLVIERTEIDHQPLKLSDHDEYIFCRKMCLSRTSQPARTR
ncbi:hypothetical protein F5B21DRAFT_490679 [Xylaria acuta]|nr:hypothetical protein F5B21DRAFT_490679 [Xylaria acuta]